MFAESQFILIKLYKKWFLNLEYSNSNIYFSLRQVFKHPLINLHNYQRDYIIWIC